MDHSLDLERRPASPVKYLLIGCLGVIIIAVVLGGIGIWFAANNWKSWASTAATAAMTDGINDSDLPPEDKTALIARVELVAGEFEAERLSLEDMQRIFDELMASPILAIGAVEGIQQVYIAASGLTEDQKQRAKRINQRIARGLYEDRLTGEELNQIIEPLVDETGRSAVSITRDGEGTVTNFSLNIKPPEETTPEDLLAFMDNADALLAMKAIPDEPFEIDLIAEFDRAIETALGRPLLPADPPADPGPQ